jgi:nicotinamide-nucleotide amidase
MKVGIISIGDELISGYTIDTNSNFIASKLNEYNNLDVSNICVVGDDLDLISTNLDHLINSNFNYIFLTGGLGPTHDDLTKKVLCQYFNCKLRICEEHYKQLLKKNSKNKINDLKSQSEILDISEPVNNNIGTALSMHFKYKGISFFVLPGVPLEMKNILVDQILPNYIDPYFKKNNNVVTILTSGIYESLLYNKLKQVIDNRRDDIKVSFLPGYSGVKIRLSADNKGVPKESFLKFKKLIESKISKYIYGYDNDKLNEVVGRMFLKNESTLSIAESCTGGYLSKIITDTPGSSKYFKGGVVAYNNDIKIDVLNIDKNIINKYGVVSKEVASLMSENIRKKYDSTHGISTTGIAGPDGGNKNKPVGRVYVSISTNKETKCKEFTFSNNRELNRKITVFVCLSLLKRSL